MSEKSEQPKITLKQRGDEIAQRLHEVGQAGIAAAFNGYRAAVEAAIDERVDLIDGHPSADVGTPVGSAGSGDQVEAPEVGQAGPSADVGTPVGSAGSGDQVEAPPAAGEPKSDEKAKKSTKAAGKKKAGK